MNLGFVAHENILRVPLKHRSTGRSGRQPCRICCSKTVDYDIVVVGGGIAGLAFSAALKTVLKWQGSLLVIEQSSLEGLETGSALGLWTNAFKCLDALGEQVSRTLRDKSCPLEGVLIRDAERGRLLKSIPLDKCIGGPHEFSYVRRRDLQEELRSLYLSSPDVNYLVGETVESVRKDDCMIVVCSSGIELKCHIVIGADGIGSVVRKCLYPCLRWPRTIKSNGYMAFRGIVSLNQLPEKVINELESSWKSHISQIWGKGIRAGVAPLDIHHWYWFLTVNEKQLNNWDCFQGNFHLCQDKLSELLFNWVYPLPQLFQYTQAENIHVHRCADSLDILLPRKYFSLHNSFPVTLIGDAAHPTTPNLAQGAALALEDALVLACHVYSACSQSVNHEILQETLYKYEDERLLRTQRLVIQSHVIGKLLQLENSWVCFLRDNVGTKVFLQPQAFLRHAVWDVPPCFHPNK
ncbi:monooxygenase/ oxidoreductase [Galdieria sulphuraria]|uniref:Monooxygenase/ oxidoreductase n=1 Tax=Galdieria sulphuraria TaxID=130081 RepID=M2X3J6_GALSU|nr:monooxygenase/ oxidoreductase [Galdieria sulphuraria]EME30985.1 monooxygenase/ oxidoreductase [Galdieria sulphuraria]|eukprot:XP_005707505.1 monooxygenase/ oxidoreductase [Galdieria sulphuraria]